MKAIAPYAISREFRIIRKAAKDAASRKPKQEN